MRSFLNLKLPDAPGLVKHVSVSPAPSVPGPGDSNLLSYVYRLGSSAAANPDYITLKRRQEQWTGGVRPGDEGQTVTFLMSVFRFILAV